MARKDPSPQGKQPSSEPPDGIPLTEDDLEIVVGGLSPAASLAYVEYLRDPTGRQTRAARADGLRSSADARRHR